MTNIKLITIAEHLYQHICEYIRLNLLKDYVSSTLL